ncbi:hypothetical protein LJ656_26975 [Paraburkholderia sp. MMS20-SJTR3]|uniref:Immunity protein 50 n=1 Tax=Paraburkholderia sejongensis TaxID=2886946 RepID=A0ABS8K260_9BURK|nr:hypothetical protein [Paraburkholderia sp. MMS20-SJTR3]MCC8396237.1 hypothetical protein [Paraburkholderia sp. MMS20-SJTR3]
MTANTVTEWNHFHDWYLDSISVGPDVESCALTLGLYFDSKRVAVTFEGVTCMHLDGFGPQNIVYSIRPIEPGETNYDATMVALSKAERLVGRKAQKLVFMYASLGAELAVEFDSLTVRAISARDMFGGRSD